MPFLTKSSPFIRAWDWHALGFLDSYQLQTAPNNSELFRTTGKHTDKLEDRYTNMTR